MRAVAFVLCLAVFVPLMSLSAQEPATIEPGARVRVTAPDLGLQRSVGTCLAVSNDSIRLQGGAGILDIPLASMTALDVSRGRKSNALRGLLIGSIVGAPIGAVLGGVGSHRETPTSEAPWCYEGTAACVASHALVVGAVGGLVGLGIGALSKTDRWEEVPLDQWRVSLAVPRNGRWRVGVSLVF